jgi:predicted NodU family carbamoyl transferase
MKDGYYLSIYAHLDKLGACYNLTARHDQNMALWLKTGSRVELVRYWEFERYSGHKHHGIPFFDRKHAWDIITKLLAEANIKPQQLNAVWGTPGLSSENDSWMKDKTGLSSHILSHLYSAVLFDTNQFYTGTTLALALDGGPDSLLDHQSPEMPFYAGAVVKNGNMEIFPIPSPGGLWASLSHLTKMEEGSLMALGSASSCSLNIPVEHAPTISCITDFSSAWDWVEKLIHRVNNITVDNTGSIFSGFDPLFTEKENRISMAVKVVQQESKRQVVSTVESILEKYNLTPSDTKLALSGGFALNCPTNTYLMHQFGFAGFQAPPCVNDSGISLGYGLHAFLHFMDRFNFITPSAGMGMVNQSSSSSSPDKDYITKSLDDLEKGPIAWVEGGAEMGPRALGHRSLLADPRKRAMQDSLNHAKQRQWWRPVAPVILAEYVDEWFDDGLISPFMLHVMHLKPERINQVPAIAHIDGSARVQTLTSDEAPLLYNLIHAFYEQTGIPMLCNTSLNDKGEPIINSYEEALTFAARRGVKTCYLDGQRRIIPQTQTDMEQSQPSKRMAQDFSISQSLRERTKTDLNPHGLTRKELALWINSPRLKRLDPKNKAQADVIIRYYKKIINQSQGRPLPLDLLLKHQESI